MWGGTHGFSTAMDVFFPIPESRFAVNLNSEHTGMAQTSHSNAISYQWGLNVFPVSSSVFRRERIRGHPSAQAA